MCREGELSKIFYDLITIHTRIAKPATLACTIELSNCSSQRKKNYLIVMFFLIILASGGYWTNGSFRWRVRLRPSLERSCVGPTWATRKGTWPPPSPSAAAAAQLHNFRRLLQSSERAFPAPTQRFPVPDGTRRRIGSCCGGATGRRSRGATRRRSPPPLRASPPL